MVSTPGERFTHRLVPFVAPALILAALAGLVLISRDAVATNPRFLADPRDQAVVRHPSWMSAALGEALAQELSMALRRPASLLGRQDLDAWEAALPGLSPWIKSVRAVSARFPYQAEVWVELRRPVLVVEGDLLVSASGTVLGAGEVDTDPPPLAYAGPITNEDIVECAVAAGEIRAFHDQISEMGLVLRGVGVSAEGLVVFSTDRGVEIEWGRSARRLRLAALDLPQHRRIRNLADVVRKHPGLEGVRRVQLWLERPRIFLTPGREAPGGR